jgi:hypothetical protein
MSAADRAGPRGISRSLNPPQPVGNNPVNDALNASQSTKGTPLQPHQETARGAAPLTSIELNTPRPSLRQRALERATAFIDRNNPFVARAKIAPSEPQSFELTGGRRYRDALDEEILGSIEETFGMSEQTRPRQLSETAQTIEDSLALDRANAERMERIRTARETPLQPQDRAALGPAPAPPSAPPAQVETSLKPKYPKPAPFKEKATISTDTQRLASARKALQDINEDLNNKKGFKDGFDNRKTKTPQEIESLKKTKANVEKMITELEAKVAKRTPQPRTTPSMEERFEFEFERMTEPIYENGRLMPEEASHRISQKADAAAQSEATRLWKEKLKNEFLATGQMPEENVRIEHARNAINEAEDALTKGTPLQPQEAKGTPRQPQEPTGEEMIDLRKGTPLQPQEAKGTPRQPQEAKGTPRQPRPIEEMGEEIGSLRTQNSIAELNDIHDFMMNSAKQEGFVVPEAPESIKAQGELAVKKYQYEQALEFAEKEGLTVSDVVIERGQRKLTGKAVSKKKQLQQFQEVYERARIQEGGRPSARAAAAPVEARAARPAAPEARAARPAAPAAPAAAEMAARPPGAAPTLTAPEPAGSRVRAQVESINTSQRPAPRPETARGAAPLTEPAGPSPPPSAPGTETATPREGAITERTPRERAAFAEEVSAGLSKKPSRQKAKINFGKPDKTTRNPLDRFVSAEFRNTPNLELHPGARNLRGALVELGSRVPRLVPTRQALISAGGNLAAEGGGLVGGFFAGSYAGQKMNEYFATHPPKNRGEEFGQALATSMVALGVGNLVSKVITYVIKQGVRVAAGAAVSGSISSAGVGGGTAILEAALFATVATTTQYFTTKALEDAGYNHEFSRSQGSLAATVALMDLELASFLLKGGPLNLAADVSFVVSEIFIIGFGIWSYFEEKKEGAAEDAEEESIRAEREQEIKERNESIARINKTNSSRAAFMIALETHDYDFDELYATLSEQQKIELGISTPEGKTSFQRQVESAFDPFNMFEEPSTGLVTQPTLSPIELQRREVFNSYINYYLAELQGENPPAFNFNDPKVIELNEYSGGTWQSAAEVSATTSHMQSSRINPLIENAQNEIIDAFHKEHKTIEEMPPEVVRYAMLDSNFRDSYETYIVADAQAQILVEFNNTQYTYDDMDPKLVEIAMRDPTFKTAADAYYQILANQARDFNLTISEVAHLNSLMENEQTIEVGKLNDARSKIIAKNMADNQATIDAYNASIVREINMYGDNFESIIRNINDQALVTGHTFLYATNRADLYRQLHMEMPELELVDPGDEVDQPDATWHPGKGRKVGDTALYGYEYGLTDEQREELNERARREGFINDKNKMEHEAAIMYERDHLLYEETDQERADSLGMSLTDYYDKFGIPVDPYKMEIENYRSGDKPPQNGRVRMPDDSIHTYRNGILVNVERVVDTIKPAEVVPFDSTLEKQPDGRVSMPDGSIRDYKDGKVIFVNYPPNTNPATALTPDQINAQAETSITPVSNVLYNGERAMPDGTTRSYKDGKVVMINYPVEFPRNKMITDLKILNKNEGVYYDPNPSTTETGSTQPQTNVKVLFTGDRKMPNKSIRTYKDGQIIGVRYPEGFLLDRMDDEDLTPEGIANLNKREGLYYDTNPQAQVTPTTPTPTGELKNGDVTMPDGSRRTYKNGLVVFIVYPAGSRLGGQKTLTQINTEEGTRDALYTGPEVVPVTPSTPSTELQQGFVKMPDGSKRMYIDGKVVSVAYAEGVTGPTINEINAAEGTKEAAPRIENPMNAVDDFFKGKTPKEPVAPVTPAQKPAPAPTPTPGPSDYRPRQQEPMPAPTN